MDLLASALKVLPRIKRKLSHSRIIKTLASQIQLQPHSRLKGSMREKLAVLIQLQILADIPLWCWEAVVAVIAQRKTFELTSLNLDPLLL